MVSKDFTRIRVQMNAKLSTEELDSVIEAIKGMGKKLTTIK